LGLEPRELLGAHWASSLAADPVREQLLRDTFAGLLAAGGQQQQKVWNF
jgi:hypothetical protein